jgi:hypothetical protein
MVDSAQEPARDGEEPIGDAGGKRGVRLLVSSLGSGHEIGLHLPHPHGWHRSRPLHHTVWAESPDVNFNLRPGRP